MWLLGLCIGLWALFARHVSLDQFSWLMLVAASWFCGFMDARMFARSDKEDSRPLPGESAAPENEPTDDSPMFESR